MFEATTSFTDPKLGKVVRTARMEDSGDAVLKLMVNGVETAIQIPVGTLNSVCDGLTKLRNMERSRLGLTYQEYANAPDEDEDED